MQTWNKEAKPSKGAVVICLEGGRLYFGKVINGYWVACDLDGSMIFGRNGSPVYAEPDYWIEIPQ